MELEADVGDVEGLTCRKQEVRVRTFILQLLESLNNSKKNIEEILHFHKLFDLMNMSFITCHQITTNVKTSVCF